MSVMTSRSNGAARHRSDTSGTAQSLVLTDLVKTTLGGSFNHVRSEVDADQLFHQVLTNQKNVQAIHAVLRLWLAPEIHAGELYRTRPEILYVGDLEPDPDNQVELRAAVNAAVRANVAIYPVDARGLQAVVPGAPVRAGTTN